MAVPTLGQVGEEARHGRRSADSICQHPRDLAGRAQGGTCFPGHPGEPASGMKSANERPASWIGQRPEQPREDLSRRPVHERVEAGGQRAAEDLGRDVGLGRAAGVREQAGVVRLRGGPSVDAQLVGGAHRDHRRLQARARTGSPCRGPSLGRAPRSTRRCELAPHPAARLPRRTLWAVRTAHAPTPRLWTPNGENSRLVVAP